eukprot:CAMPEP_0176234598 /NCGR_PEP_ID=MMETSP0121_2-20121125/26412_1 /TAXON_ID=160619 /ORGANISM="Kryptoperidinium foliaceum, Strain CCMP 1326" /LENGTH=285 /DNA_ID=CAMNT_0017574007 /DNA_START=9 /DNA_END=864 /DNA_ORIENTATION=+
MARGVRREVQRVVAERLLLEQALELDTRCVVDGALRGAPRPADASGAEGAVRRAPSHSRADVPPSPMAVRICLESARELESGALFEGPRADLEFAHEEGLDLSRWMSTEMMAEVARWRRRLMAMGEAGATSDSGCGCEDVSEGEADGEDVSEAEADSVASADGMALDAVLAEAPPGELRSVFRGVLGLAEGDEAPIAAPAVRHAHAAGVGALFARSREQIREVYACGDQRSRLGRGGARAVCLLPPSPPVVPLRPFPRVAAVARASPARRLRRASRVRARLPTSL